MNSKSPFLIVILLLLAGCARAAVAPGTPTSAPPTPATLPTPTLTIPRVTIQPGLVIPTDTAQPPTATPVPVDSHTGQPSPTLTGGGGMNPVLDPLVEMAKTDLAARLKVNVGDIKLQRVEDVEWPDTSLGCARPGQMYAQMVTPGFIIVLEVNGQTHEYHAGRGRVVTCEK